MYYTIALAIMVVFVTGVFIKYHIQKRRIEERENLESNLESIETEDKNKYMKDLAHLHTVSNCQRCSPRFIKKNKRCWTNLKSNYRYVRAMPDRFLNLVPSSQWIIDNYYVINREYRVLKESYSRKSYKRMPCLGNGRLKGYPRLYSVAQEILRINNFHVDEDTIVNMLDAYQQHKSLTIAEIWAFHNILKICIIESINVLSDRVVKSLKSKHKADYTISAILGKPVFQGEEITRELIKHVKKEEIGNSSFIAQILYKLKEADVEDAGFKEWLAGEQDKKGFDLSAAIRNESQYQASLQVKVSSAITSLIEVSSIDWEKLFERISPVESILNHDASGVYPKMDFSSRDEYHHRVEKMARYLKVDETDIAEKAVALSNSVCEKDKNGIKDHVGYYLLGKGRRVLEKAFKYKPSLSVAFIRWLQCNAEALYFSGVFLLALIIEMATVYYTYARVERIQLLYLTVFVIIASIISLTISIEIVNFFVTSIKKPVKLPSLDFKDRIPEEYSTMVVMPVMLCSKFQAQEYSEKLEMYYLANRHRNLYFAILGDCKDACRYEIPEDKVIIEFMSDKIKELNKKYEKELGGSFFFFHRHRKWNKKEKCWMGWERKRGKLEELNRMLMGEKKTSYNTIIGNREVFQKLRYIITIDADTELTKDSAGSLIGVMAHPLNTPVLNKDESRVIGGYALLQPKVGVRVDYAMASLFSRTFAGQAGVEPYSNAVSDIYQDAFEEGSFTGKGIYDIKVFNKVLSGTIPENAVLSHDLLEGCYTRCALVTRVGLMDGYPSTVESFFRREHRWIRGDWQLLPWLFGRDTLGFLARWKIFDNLRRSMLPVSQLVITLMVFSVFKWELHIWAVFILFSMLFSLIVNVSNTTLYWIRKYGTNTYISNFLNSILTVFKQGVIVFILTPYRAHISIDAIIRTIYRMFISKKKLLEWQTAESVERTVENSMTAYFKRMWTGPFFGILAILLMNKTLWYVSFPIGIMWVLNPVISFYISITSKKRKKVHLKPAQIEDIRQIARRTWRYFEEFFTERDNWLSPDNYQLSPENVIAGRTSPTNIGMQMLSTLSARDLGYISLNEFIDRLEKVLSTILKMERWNGHLYNWYDTRNLRVLYPRYVSTVDSGNFTGYLIVLKNALKELKNRPVFSENEFKGFIDTIKLANIDNPFERPISLEGWNKLLKTVQEAISEETESCIDGEWVNLLVAMCDGFKRDLEIFELLEVENKFELSLNKLHLLNSKKASGIVERIDRLIQIIDDLINDANFKPLYDERRGLFWVGFNVSINSPDNCYYDLLASEARLTSFIAISKGDVHKKHWFKLGRPMTLIHGIPTLISWSGTMFEYLLPNLVMKVYPGTVIEQSCRAAVRRQIEYGQMRKVPWGISESGYYHFDRNLNYQYKAFGVPGLGFKSDLRKSLVIAPYATLLAMQVNPIKAYRNLKLLRSINAEGKYGFYEALDFMSNIVNKQKEYKLIKSFMIHHQGMSLVSLNNFINDNHMQRRFHSEPIIKANELILEELQPHGVVIKNDEEKVSPSQTGRISRRRKENRIVKSIRPRYPVAHVYSNNHYTVMMTSNGGGVSRFNDISINRWRPVLNEDCYGMFFYIRNINTKEFWSSAYMPSGVEPENYSVVFSQDKAEFIRKDGNIETKTEIVVSARDNIEVRRITLYNRGKDLSDIEVTSYFEPVIDTHDNDLAHPAFSKLFIATEFIEEKNTLLASRRTRKENDYSRYIFSTVTVQGRDAGEVEYETDRYKFIGWGNTLRKPQALLTDLPLSNTIGNVLDPIISLRVNVKVLPGRPVVVTYVTGIGHSRNEAIELASRYRNGHAVEDVFKMALFDSELEMQYLGITPQQVSATQDMVGSIYYPSRLLRGPVDIIEKNTMGQSGLWKFGISGDNPIILFRIRDINQIASLKDAMLAYEYLRKNGIESDFIILNEESDDYFQPLNHQINEIISNRRIYYPNSKKSGIYVLKGRQMSQDEIRLLLTAARIVLSEKNHLLSRRVKKLLMDESIEFVRNPINKKAKMYSSTAFETGNLKYFNGAGGFSQDGKEYVILVKDKHNIPGPWSNIIANDKFGALISASGSGYTWSINSRENKLTTWSNDPVIDPPSEILYIRDEYTGELFSPTPSPIREKQPYRVRHGFGYSIFEHNSHGINQKLTVFISGRDPVKLYKLSLENTSDKTRLLSLCFYVEWVLGVERGSTAPFIVTEMDDKFELLTARNTYNQEFKNRIAFIGASEKIASYTGDRMEFIGRTGHAGRPMGLIDGEFSNRVGAAFDPCGAIKVNIKLQPDESRDVVFILGEAVDRETAELLTEAYRRHRVVDVVLSKTKASWKRILEQTQVQTPDEEMNILLNGWLLYQTISCRMRARSAFYQSGGAYGFRDQLQDSMSLLHTSPDLVREQILKCCRRQFVEGDVQHWWHDDSGKGVRTRISDDLLWLPYVTAVYIKFTGDIDILTQEASYIEDKELAPLETERFSIPNVSTQKGSVYEHCIRAIEKGCVFGDHGLPLMGAGDWNDGMNTVGWKGKGESVWLGWFVYKVLRDFSFVSRLKNDVDRAQRYENTALVLKENIEKTAWDGEWYVRAYFDNGEPLGSRQNNECRIDSISQTWGVISKGADAKRATSAMEALQKYLIKEEDKITLLLTPPFDRMEPSPGYIKGYLPGIRENGGQYTHAAVWNVIAFVEMGDGNRAHSIFKMLNPINHTKTYSDMIKYKQEPYVMTADVYSAFPHAGRGGWSWYTGSAGWMYQAGVFGLLGVVRRGDRLIVNPTIPEHWKAFSVVYKFGGSKYRINVENPEGISHGVVSMIMDGEKVYNEGILLEDDGMNHDVLVTMKKV